MTGPGRLVARVGRLIDAPPPLACAGRHGTLRGLCTGNAEVQTPSSSRHSCSRRRRAAPAALHQPACLALDHNTLDLVDGDRVRRPVVELRRLGRRVPGDLLGVLEGPPVRQIRRDPRRPERVAAGRGRQPRGHRPALDHGQDGAARQRPTAQPRNPSPAAKSSVLWFPVPEAGSRARPAARSRGRRSRGWSDWHTRSIRRNLDNTPVGHSRKPGDPWDEIAFISEVRTAWTAGLLSKRC